MQHFSRSQRSVALMLEIIVKPCCVFLINFNFKVQSLWCFGTT